MLGAYLTSALTSYASPWLQAGAIILCTLILEDATTILVAMAVVDGVLSPEVALLALFVGVALGDFGLYWGGRLVGRHGWARRFVHLPKLDVPRDWLSQHAFASVMSARFLPGFRLPTYAAFGLVGVPFGRFAISVVVATLLWTTLLFGASLAFGNLFLAELGQWRWLGAILAALAVVVIGHYIARSQTT